MEQDLLFFLIGLLSFLLIFYLLFLCGYGIMVLEIGRDKLLDKSEFEREFIWVYFLKRQMITKVSL